MTRRAVKKITKNLGRRSLRVLSTPTTAALIFCGKKKGDKKMEKIMENPIHIVTVSEAGTGNRWAPFTSSTYGDAYAKAQRYAAKMFAEGNYSFKHEIREGK